MKSLMLLALHAYDAANVYLFMAGVWRVTIAVTPANAGDAGAPESVQFFFCIAG